MRNALWLPVLVSAFALSGCVTIDAPIGERLTAEQAARLTGRWLNPEKPEDGVVEIRLKSDGKLAAGSLEWDDQQQTFKANSLELEARRIGEATYLYFRGPEQSEDGYVFNRIEFPDDSQMQWHGPKIERFAAAIESGKLTGEIVNSDGRKSVRIVADSDTTRKFFASSDWKDYYNADAAVVLKRISALTDESGTEDPDEPESGD